MKFIVVFDVISVFQIELLRAQFNFVTDRYFNFAFLLNQFFEVLSRELYNVFRAGANNLFNIVFKNGWEGVGDLDLLGSKNALVVNV